MPVSRWAYMDNVKKEIMKKILDNKLGILLFSTLTKIKEY